MKTQLNIHPLNAIHFHYEIQVKIEKSQFFMRPVFNKTKRLLDVTTSINGYSQYNRLIVTD